MHRQHVQDSVVHSDVICLQKKISGLWECNLPYSLEIEEGHRHSCVPSHFLAF